MGGTVSKAIAVLDALRDSPHALGAREIAARSGLAKSSVQRLLTELEQLQLAVQDPTSRKYRLGPHTLTLGMAYRDRLDLRNLALPHMRALRDATQETIGLSVRIGQTRMFIEEVQSQSELRAHSELGQPYPIWMGAPGRVLLAGMTDEALDRLFEPVAESGTGMDPPIPADLLDELAEVRRRGHARARDETIPGISAVAVPIYDAAGQVTAALSVSGPTARMSEPTMQQVVRAAAEAAATISHQLGGRAISPAS